MTASRRRAKPRPTCEWASDCRAPAAVLLGPTAVLACLGHYAEAVSGGTVAAAGRGHGPRQPAGRHSADAGGRVDAGGSADARHGVVADDEFRGLYVDKPGGGPRA